MVSRRFTCDQSRLRLALDDGLREDDQRQLATHLEQCHDCRTTLESLAAGRDWWQKARSHLAADVLNGHSEEPPGSAAIGSAAKDDQPWLGFLTPSDDERYIGYFASYPVIELIGSGGFGVVLKALDPALNRFVAIKVLSPQLANSGAARRRFAREAQAAAAVVHEHVVAIHSVAEHEGLPYLVMPYIAGCSLEERLDRDGPLEVSQILRIGMQVAAGLAAAHAQGLVHRDIKPGNILLESGVERVKITDFGLARTVDDASLTASGIIAGTPQYMAPEQARGDAVDHRSDLFSLGSVLYAMCTGHSPFRAETFMAVWRRLCVDAPRPVREINHSVPDWLAEIIEHLHCKDPGDRIQTADEVADLLARHLAHLQQPSVAPRPARSRKRAKLRDWSRRSGWIALGAAVCLVVTVAWWWPWRSANEDNPQTRTTEKAADNDPARREATQSADGRIAEWNQELKQARNEINSVWRELKQPASTLDDGQDKIIGEIITALDEVEQKLNRGL